MAGKRVPVLAPDPKTGRLRFATVDESEAELVTSSGGRLLTKQESDVQEAELRQAERAEKAGAVGTAQTVLGAVGGAINPLAFMGGPGSIGEAYNRGVTGGLTAGLSDVATAKAAEAIAPGAGAKVARQADDIKLTSPTAHTAGEIMGFTAGAVGMPASPAGLIGKAGNIAERGAGLILKGGGGVARQALTTSGKMAIRGAFEGAAVGAIQSGADDLLHDNPINGKKLYAAMGHNALAGAVIGGGLGTGGSLLSSSIKSARGGAARALARASEGATAEAGAAARKPSMLVGLLDAHEQAWKAAGGGFGLQSTRYAKSAAKYFPDGPKALGEVSIRYGVMDVPQGLTPTQAAIHSAKVNTPAEMLPRAETALDGVGKQLGEITEASGARIQATQVMQAVEDVASHYESTAATRPVGRSIRSFATDLVDSLGLRSLDDSTAIQNLIRERKGIDRIAFQDAPTLDPKTTLEAKRMLRGKLEDLIEVALDEASGKVPGELRSKYTGLKKDYHKLALLTETLEDSAARASKAATLGLGEKFAVASSVASGNIAAAPVLALGGKVLRERGNAAAAAFLTRAAEQQAVRKLVKQSEQAVEKAAAGAIREAEAAPARAAKGKLPQVTAEQGRAQQRAVVEQANAIVKWAGDTKANPRRVLDALQEAGAVVGRAAGSQTSAAYTEATMRAMQFIMRYVPVKERRDPLDPRSVPPLTYEEAARLVRATTYATKPMTVWADFERGIVTPEGLAAATEFMPDQFADFRAQLLEHVTSHLARGERLSAAQRLRVDKLLGIPGGADLRGPALVQLQANLSSEGPDNSSGPTPAKNTGGSNGPVNMKVQQSGFDAVEARKSG